MQNQGIGGLDGYSDQKLNDNWLTLYSKDLFNWDLPLNDRNVSSPGETSKLELMYEVIKPS